MLWNKLHFCIVNAHKETPWNLITKISQLLNWERKKVERWLNLKRAITIMKIEVWGKSVKRKTIDLFDWCRHLI